MSTFVAMKRFILGVALLMCGCTAGGIPDEHGNIRFKIDHVGVTQGGLGVYLIRDTSSDQEYLFMIESGAVQIEKPKGK